MKNYSDNAIDRSDVLDFIVKSVDDSSVQRDEQHEHLCTKVSLLVKAVTVITVCNALAIAWIITALT